MAMKLHENSNIDIYTTYHHILERYCGKITLVKEILIAKIESTHIEHFKLQIKPMGF